MSTPKVNVALAVLLCFVFLVNAEAQVNLKEATRNYKEGFVITTQGDTLRGKIDYREWRQNPAVITFIKQGDLRRQFIPTELLEFQVGGDTYRSRKVDLDVSSFKLSYLNNTAVPTIVKDTTLFVRLLIDGELDLYYFQDLAHKDHFFYQEEGQPATELAYYRYYQDLQSQKVVSREIYKGQLRVLALKCDKEQLDYNISYGMKDFIKFFGRYNTCLSGGESGQSVHRESKGRINFAVIAGVQYSRFSFYQMSGPASSYSYRSKATDVVPVFGLGLNYAFPRGLGKYGLSSSIIYNHQEVEGIYDVSSRRSYVDEYKLHTIQLFGAFRYAPPVSFKFKPYVSAGPSLIYFIDPKLVKSQRVYYTSGRVTQNSSGEYGFQKLMGGATLSLGASWNKYAFEVRIHRELANGHAGDGRSRASHFAGLLSYSLF